ncbi:hypothetical protein [Sphingomonas bacterium]|uniref:hypothetical protein n=1 Tax=Sphingomonas bacterium TaxID=1895847 RepID=UPI00157629C4|nr:hypothetical protein [Sphingomonas bacterium]
MRLDLAAVAREAAARWRQDRMILSPLSGLLLFVPQWATLMLVPDPPAMPGTAAPVAVQAWAEAVQVWAGRYGTLCVAAFVVAQLGQLAIVALYVGGERPTAGAALLQAARLLLRFLLAGIVVAMPSLALGLVAASAPMLLALVVPAVVYVLGRTMLLGAALLGRPGTGAVRAVVLSWRWTRGHGIVLSLLVGGLLVTMSVAIQLVEATIEALRHAGIANPTVLAALDAGAAGVAWAAMLALAMMQGVLYRRLAR